MPLARRGRRERRQVELCAPRLHAARLSATLFVGAAILGHGAAACYRYVSAAKTGCRRQVRCGGGRELWPGSGRMTVPVDASREIRINEAFNERRPLCRVVLRGTDVGRTVHT